MTSTKIKITGYEWEHYIDWSIYIAIHTKIANQEEYQNFF